MATLVSNSVNCEEAYCYISNTFYKAVNEVSVYTIGDVKVEVTHSVTTYDDGVVEKAIEINPEKAVDGIPGWIYGDMNDSLVQVAMLTLSL